MIVRGVGEINFQSIVDWGSADQLGNWLEQQFNGIWYGQPDPSLIPVSVVGAPQSKDQMTSGTFTPLDAAVTGQEQYQQKVKTYFDTVPSNAGNANVIMWGLIGVGVLGVLYLRKKVI